MKLNKVIFRKVCISYAGQLSAPAISLLTALAMLLDLALNLGDKAVVIVAEELTSFNSRVKSHFNDLLK